MDPLTESFREHHAKLFAKYGATARGVDWNDKGEMLFRYEKILKVLDRDFRRPDGVPSLLDVGCGWGGLFEHGRNLKIPMDYTGIDVVPEMVEHASEVYPEAIFRVCDVFDMEEQEVFDYVVCNAILTQRLTASIVEMERHARNLIEKMFSLCRFGIVFTMMSTRVNFMADNLYYQNPAEMFHFCLTHLSPKVRVDHGYSSLQTGEGKYYDFTVYVYRD